jgi:Tfp pilus assembly protein FimT
MCKSSNGINCSVTAISELTADWKLGWIVFTDDSPSPASAGVMDGADTLLRVQGGLSGGSTLVGNANVINYISYASNGQTQLDNGGKQGGTFYLCSQDTSADGRQIIISLGTGRARVEKVSPPVQCS